MFRNVFILSAALIGFHNSSYSSDKKPVKATRTIKVQQQASPTNSSHKIQSSQAIIATAMTAAAATTSSSSSIHPLLLQQKTSQYNPQRDQKSCYNPSAESYKISRSRLENFLKCPRCFYIDRKLGTDHPAGFPFTLNNAVDNNMKNEFDVHRENQTMHPYCAAYDQQAEKDGLPKINAIPFKHADINKWRNSLHQG